jgi:hypothetical protein
LNAWQKKLNSISPCDPIHGYLTLIFMGSRGSLQLGDRGGLHQLGGYTSSIPKGWFGFIRSHVAVCTQFSIAAGKRISYRGLEESQGVLSYVWVSQTWFVIRFETDSRG